MVSRVSSLSSLTVMLKCAAALCGNAPCSGGCPWAPNLDLFDFARLGQLLKKLWLQELDETRCEPQLSTQR